MKKSGLPDSRQYLPMDALKKRWMVTLTAKLRTMVSLVGGRWGEKGGGQRSTHIMLSWTKTYGNARKA